MVTPVDTRRLQGGTRQQFAQIATSGIDEHQKHDMLFPVGADFAVG